MIKSTLLNLLWLLLMGCIALPMMLVGYLWGYVYAGLVTGYRVYNALHIKEEDRPNE